MKTQYSSTFASALVQTTRFFRCKNASSDKVSSQGVLVTNDPKAPSLSTISRCLTVVAFATALLSNSLFAQNFVPTISPLGNQIPVKGKEIASEKTQSAQSPSTLAEFVANSPAEIQPSELQYVRLSDLTGSGNTQYTYTPASYNKQELQSKMHSALQQMSLTESVSVNVVVYLTEKGTITHVNFIGDAAFRRNDVAKNVCDAVAKCTFKPALRNEKPVHSVVVIPVKFIF